MAAAASITQFRLLSTFIEAPLRVSGSAVDESVERLDAIGVLWLVAVVVTAASFIAWLYRAYRNLEAFGARSVLRYAAGWSIGAWFVPFLNLWRPKQIVDDTWRASDPDLPSGPHRGEDGKPPLLHHFWWGLWITVGFLGYFTSRNEAGNLDSLRVFLVADSISSIIAVFAAIAAFLVVAGTTSRQEARADRVFVDRQDPTRLLPAAAEPAAVDRFWPIVVGLLAVGALAFGAAFVAFDNTSAMSDEELATGATTIPEGPTEVFGAETLRVGDCFDLTPTGNTEVTSCDQAHAYEAYAVATHPAGAAAAFPGDLEVDNFAFEACLAEVEGFVGSRLLGSGLDITWFIPTVESWAASDRGVVCALTPLSYQPTEASFAATGGFAHEGQRGFGEFELGDCFDDQASGFAPLTECSDPHDNEVYAVEVYPVGPEAGYPGQDALAAFALETCTDGFPGYVGVSVFNSALAIFEIWPSPFTWSAGDHTVVCVLFDPDFGKLEGSMRGSER